MRSGVAATVVALLAGLVMASPVAARPQRQGHERYVAVNVAAPHRAAAHPQTPHQAPPRTKQLPFGGTRILPGRTLVAYYGTAGTGSLGVLGERGIGATTRDLRAAARPFARPGRPVQIVYELITTVADRSPGPDGDYSHDISRAAVRRYLRAAHRHHALLVLDLQPGRSGFLTVARRWAWALKDPWVGLALDPEWRMGPHQVPGRVVGSVGAAEVNRVSGWLSRLTRAHHLPDKVLVLHQFRTSMVTDIGHVVRRPGLELVQHVDGYGTPGQKLATFRAVQRPGRFTMGFKLFYDEDVHRMSAARVLQIRPRVRFVSFQ